MTMESRCGTGGQMKSPDLAVIGAGSAGFAAAIRASELGARVLLVGHGTIGGTCVNVGCVPSKTLIRAAETFHQARSASRFAGIRAEARLDDWRTLVAQKDELVASLRKAKYSDLLPAYPGATYVEGAARLTADGVVVNGTLYTPGKTIIATGASASLPRIDGIEGVPWLDSTASLSLETLPASLVVIGGGVIGCELGQMFARLGVKVTIVCRSHLLPHAEPAISEALAATFRDEGIDVRCGVSYQSVAREGGGIALALSAKISERIVVTAERLLVATGRKPNTGGLGLEQAGVQLAANGGVLVDEWMRTTRPDVYAAGDVTGRDMFVYMAAYGAKLAAENALTGDSRRYDASAMPDVTFTDPQVASVGLTEEGAQRQGIDARAVTVGLDLVPRALAARDTQGLIKLVAERGSGKLLGAHIMAAEAGDSIQTAVLALRHGLTVADLADTLFPYLTMVEGIKLAALGFGKDVKKLSCCAG